MKNYFEEAQKRIHGQVVGDSASELAANNLLHGIANLLYNFDTLGIPHDVQFSCSADFTITKNKDRFRDGFAMGGVLSLGNEKVAIKNIRPNACGMTVIGLKDYPDFLNKAVELSKEWDIANGNHFISIGETQSYKYKYVAVFHGGSADKTLLYPSSDSLEILTDVEAISYYETYKRQEEMTSLKRTNLVKALFPNGDIISDIVHQGMIVPDTYILGCHVSDGETIYPFMTTNSTDSYLLKAPKGTILPHGVGYALPQYEEVLKVEYIGGKRLFFMKTKNGTEIIDRPNGTFAYRDPKEVKELLQAEVIMTIKPITSIKF